MHTSWELNVRYGQVLTHLFLYGARGNYQAQTYRPTTRKRRKERCNVTSCTLRLRTESLNITCIQRAGDTCHLCGPKQLQACTSSTTAAHALMFLYTHCPRSVLQDVIMHYVHMTVPPELDVLWLSFPEEPLLL